MEKKYSLLPRVPLKADCKKIKGDFAAWKHSFGHGGVNNYPVPPDIVNGLALLKPKLIRTFIQEFFFIYPDHDTFDWTKLDPFMDALAGIGAKIVACIAIKPKPLYPVVDQKIIMPNDAAEWQRVIEALVRRYSVTKKIVTHWEISNEPDIGEMGGSPYLASPEQYNEYYRLTAEAILRAFPDAKVGGPALSNPWHPIMESLVSYCAGNGLPLDFISWHGYSDNPPLFSGGVKHVCGLTEKYFPGKKIEKLVTEFNKWFHEAKIEDAEQNGMRSAIAVASAFEMQDAGADFSFLFHIWDHLVVAEQFAPFFSDPDYMQTFWNKLAGNFGMFDVCGKPRLIYFAYKLLSQICGDECETESPAPDLKIKCAVSAGGCVNAVLVNYDPRSSRDVVAEVDFVGISDGFKLLTVSRIDEKTRIENGSVVPVERRYLQTSSKYSDRPFFCHVLMPADSVTYMKIEPVTEEEMLKSYGYK
ncbi:MAG: hypothetical protein FWE82_08065 [Defluviitaleaceae bacterium]|nr:hypothetical protein [Defluviitaleaceae bacterium]